MKIEFTNYMKDISLSKVMINAISKKYELLKIAANVEEFDDIFISETLNKDGTREYFSLWGFSSTLFCKISINRKGEDSEMVLLRLKDLATFEFENFNYDLVNPIESSTLITTSYFSTSGKGASFYATGINCSHLQELITKYIISNLNK